MRLTSREFKFRVWDKVDKKFDRCISDSIRVTCDGLKSIWGDRCVIHQSTGVMDKNGKEIFEGDIVKTDPNHITLALSSHAVPYTRGVVTWLREGFAICQAYIGGNDMHYYVACDCCPCGLEIIGNIFENPELIDDKSNPPS